MSNLVIKRDGFRILVLGDIQVHGEVKEPLKLHLRSVTRYARPDFVVFLGDMISGLPIFTAKGFRKVISEIIDSTVGTKIPFAVVSGNHDLYTILPFLRQIELYQEFSNCLTPSIKSRSSESAYTLDVNNESGSPVCRLLFIDCAGSLLSLHGMIYKPTADNTLDYTGQILSDPSCPPVMVFQHVIVPDIRRAIKVTGGRDGVRGKGPFIGKRIALKNPDDGILGECPCPAWKDTRQFADWAKSGKVRAAVFAHDHVNSFETMIDGIKIIQCPSAGFDSYGNAQTRGARVVTISRDGKISSEPIYYKNL